MQELIVLRGLPGSGKTTFAKKTFPEHDHFAADDLFEEMGKFIPSLLGRAHRECQENTRNALQAGRSVCVHNTNTTHREINPYAEMAQQMGIRLRVVHVESGLSDEELVVSTVHGVPLDTIRAMRQRWQDWTGEEHENRNRGNGRKEGRRA